MKKEKVSEVIKIINESKLSMASFSNVGMPYDEFEKEVRKIAKRIVKKICRKKLKTK